MQIQEIIEIKDLLNSLKDQGIISDWELPYENLLTRRSAAIFFLDPSKERRTHMSEVWNKFERYENFSFRINSEKKLSAMTFRITFSKEEFDKKNALELSKEEPMN